MARPSGHRLAWAAATVAVGIALAGSGCTSSDTAEEVNALCPSSAAAATGSDVKPAAIALLGEDRLVRFSLTSGRVEKERSLPVAGTPSSSIAAGYLRVPGQLLVQPPHEGVVLVLVRRPTGRDVVLAVDSVTLDTECRYPLERGVRYRAIAVGASDRIYAFGYREGRDPKKLAALLTTLEPRGRSRPVTETVRPPTDGWFPYWGAVSADERHVVFSYHGSTSGADWLEAAGGGFRRCQSSGPASFICVGEVHGAVAPYGDGFLATTGEGMIEVGWNGRIVELPLRPRDVHLMDFALDSSRGLVYISSCGERPAIQRLDLEDMRVTDGPSGPFCGVPLAVYGDRYLVLAATRADEAVTEPPIGPLRVLDLRHPGPGVAVGLSGLPQDAIAISTDD
jgi:hypothetical protein